MKNVTLPLNFTNVWNKYRWSLKLMIFENDKSYVLNKFVYALVLIFS